MKWWPWKRATTPAPQPQSAAEPPPVPVPVEFGLRDLTLDEQVIATSNVMAIRDAVSVFLAIVREHRSDGHDCPPYCVPSRLDYFLEMMDERDLRMTLTVMLKDMVESWLQQQAEQ